VIILLDIERGCCIVGMFQGRVTTIFDPFLWPERVKAREIVDE
jgi:hypothetical protein